MNLDYMKDAQIDTRKVQEQGQHVYSHKPKNT